MIKSDIITALRQSCGGEFITKSQLAKAFSIKNARYVSEYVEGLDKVSGKYYLVAEVAENILRRCE